MILLNGSFRHNRTHFARQNSLKNNLTDIFVRQLWTCDREVLSFIKPCLPKRPDKTHPEGVRKLFLQPKPLPPPSNLVDSPESECDSESESQCDSDSECESDVESECDSESSESESDNFVDSDDC